jgi:hypothetical protein
MEETVKVIRDKQEKVVLTFLKQTQEGKYVAINKQKIVPARVNVQREEPYEEVYYYGVR